LNPVTPPLAASSAAGSAGSMTPGAEALLTGAQSGFESGGAGMTTVPEMSTGGPSGWWNQIKGYADSPYGQFALKQGLGMATQKRPPPSPMNIQLPELPAATPSPAVDRLAWLRAFNVQG
jgi:hypothetical protein